MLKKENDFKEWKALDENVLYTFISGAGMSVPDWAGKNIGKVSDKGATFLSDKSEATFRTNVKGKTKKRFTFEIRLFGKKPVKLKITDGNTGKAKTVSGGKSIGIPGLEQKVLFANIEAVSDENGQFKFSFSKLVPFEGSLSFMWFGEDKTETFETGKTYNLTRSYKAYRSLDSGWSVPETGGGWTTAEKAKAQFKLASRPENDVNVALTFSFMPYANANNFIKITLPDGKVAFEKKFPDGAPMETVSFKYPLSLIKEDRIIRLTVESNLNQHNVINPGVSDARVLGVYLVAVKIGDEAK